MRMRPEEIRALGDLAGDAVSGVTEHAHDVHRVIARRVFGALGPTALPVKVMHDRITDGVYSGVRIGLRTFVRAGAAAASLRQPAQSGSIEGSTAGRLALGALNGAFGDQLERRRSPLAARMTIRRSAREVRADRDALVAAFPHPSPRLVVFVHGLWQTEDAWELGATRHVPYGYRLQAELGYTPIYVRFNSGRHISENGVELAELLGRLTLNWPVEVQEVALIGHSTGGLVARSACHYGAGSEWTSKVRHVFTLGAPHRGAPLEQLANVASSALALVPETRAFAKALNARSAGIKDMRFGYLLEDDWRGQDGDAFLHNTAREVPFLRSANHYFISAGLSREPDAPLGAMIGDLLVIRASAWSHARRGERTRFPVDHYLHLGSATHFDLLNHPAIYTQIRRWLTGRRALPAPQRP
jgi:hypothetical protein